MTKAIITHGLQQSEADTLTRIVEMCKEMSPEDRDKMIQAAEAIVLVRRLRDLNLGDVPA